MSSKKQTEGIKRRKNVKSDQSVNDSLINFLYEAGLQKRVKRSGWWIAGVKEPETVGEHSQRTALLAFILAKEEGADAKTAACMCMIHDLPECRISDGHKIANRYLNLAAAEKEVFLDQLGLLPKEVAYEWKELWVDFCSGISREALVAKDADYLECAIQAKEYISVGYSSAKNWLDNVEKKLKTASAKRLFVKLVKSDYDKWFQGLKKI